MADVCRAVRKDRTTPDAVLAATITKAGAGRIVERARLAADYFLHRDP
jgi:hypothetical protein